MRLYIDKGGRERDSGRAKSDARRRWNRTHIWVGRGYRARHGDPIIPRRCHEIASELYSIRVTRPIARRFRTLEETSLHFGLSRPGLKLFYRDRRQSVTVAATATVTTGRERRWGWKNCSFHRITSIKSEEPCRAAWIEKRRIKSGYNERFLIEAKYPGEMSINNFSGKS